MRVISNLKIATSITLVALIILVSFMSALPLEYKMIHQASATSPVVNSGFISFGANVYHFFQIPMVSPNQVILIFVAPLRSIFSGEAYALNDTFGTYFVQTQSSGVPYGVYEFEGNTISSSGIDNVSITTTNNDVIDVSWYLLSGVAVQKTLPYTNQEFGFNSSNFGGCCNVNTNALGSGTLSIEFAAVLSFNNTDFMKCTVGWTCITPQTGFSPTGSGYIVGSNDQSCTMSYIGAVGWYEICAQFNVLTTTTTSETYPPLPANPVIESQVALCDACNSVSFTFSGLTNLTAGMQLIGIGGLGSGNTQPPSFSCSDTLGQTFHVLGTDNREDVGSGGLESGICYLQKTLGGSDTITVSFSGSALPAGETVAEVLEVQDINFQLSKFVTPSNSLPPATPPFATNHLFQVQGSSVCGFAPEFNLGGAPLTLSVIGGTAHIENLSAVDFASIDIGDSGVNVRGQIIARGLGCYGYVSSVAGHLSTGVAASFFYGYPESGKTTETATQITSTVTTPPASTTSTTVTTTTSTCDCANQFSFNGLLPDLLIWLIIIGGLLVLFIIIYYELKDQLSEIASRL